MLAKKINDSAFSETKSLMGSNIKTYKMDQSSSVKKRISNFDDQKIELLNKFDLSNLEVVHEKVPGSNQKHSITLDVSNKKERSRQPSYTVAKKVMNGGIVSVDFPKKFANLNDSGIKLRNSSISSNSQIRSA